MKNSLFPQDETSTDDESDDVEDEMDEDSDEDDVQRNGGGREAGREYTEIKEQMYQVRRTKCLILGFPIKLDFS